MKLWKLLTQLRRQGCGLRKWSLIRDLRIRSSTGAGIVRSRALVDGVSFGKDIITVVTGGAHLEKSPRLSGATRRYATLCELTAVRDHYPV